MRTLHRSAIAATVAFVAFLGWIIYLANTGQRHLLFDLAKTFPHADKLGHFLLFGLLTLLSNAATRFKVLWKLHVGSWLVLTFAGIEEVTQLFVASRTFDLVDFTADLTGIACFTVLSVCTSKYMAMGKEEREPGRPERPGHSD